MTNPPLTRLRIEVRGIVQGVGFRPFIRNLAVGRNLSGFVMNTSDGVTVEVEGEGAEDFPERIAAEAPPLAGILSMEFKPVPVRGGKDFAIVQSADIGGSTHVPPDTAVCADCLREMLDPADRRYLYPFINCTNCGPRYTITRAVPYDRPNTTMAAFEMCADCRREYDNPDNRRFHAQPNACPNCGPHVEFISGGLRISGNTALSRAVNALRSGLIVAIKGLGGFHLAADAENVVAVETLRVRKRRSNKAFALMSPDVETIRRYCVMDDDAAALLESPARPVVLMEKQAECELPSAIAPSSPRLGIMLPYAPLHHLLFNGSGLRALVMTSANMSEEPIVIGNDEAMEKLAGLADAFLLHNRDIFMRVDDSVTASYEGQTLFIRRARGYTPSPIALACGGPDILAVGADLKNTFTLAKGRAAIVSQHIGDMENYETLCFFEETLANLKQVYRCEPVAIAHDLHPGYFSTGWAMEQTDIPTIGIQHHHAHIASVLAEWKIEGEIIGVALDGSGHGNDEPRNDVVHCVGNTVWGGEFFTGTAADLKRVARFRPVPMPGGDAAAREPWRMAASFLHGIYGDEARDVLTRIGLTARRGENAVGNILMIAGNRELSPLTSGAGRLFDAVSSMLGIADINTFEGEAAIALEATAARNDAGQYPYRISEGQLAEIDFSDAIRRIIDEITGGTDKGVIAARFHNTVVAAVAEAVMSIHQATGIRDVALSGGVFQNRLILGGVVHGLRERGLAPHKNRAVPCNDGGVSLGQAFIARSLTVC
ncbi:MAG: carbamoyltransferase HypF [Nitrospirae bacterium]|nr:carbamoyltransferase HypF [Nitrospirota bacterium]